MTVGGAVGGVTVGEAAGGTNVREATAGIGPQPSLACAGIGTAGTTAIGLDILETFPFGLPISTGCALPSSRVFSHGDGSAVPCCKALANIRSHGAGSTSRAIAIAPSRNGNVSSAARPGLRAFIRYSLQPLKKRKSGGPARNCPTLIWKSNRCFESHCTRNSRSVSQSS